MERRSIDLGKTLEQADQISDGGGMLAAVCVSVGTCLITFGLSLLVVTTGTAMIIGAVVLVLTLPSAITGAMWYRHRRIRPLRLRIRENLVDHGLLLITMQDDAGERLTSLRCKPLPGVEGAGDNGAFQDRLRRLATRYRHVCRDVGLTAFPYGFGAARRNSFVTAMTCLMINGVLTIGFPGHAWVEPVRPFILGLFMVMIGNFILLHSLVGAVVTEEMINVLEDWLV